MSELLNDGRAVVVTTPRERIGHGPWARLFATAVTPDEGSSNAEAGRTLARGGAVHGVEVAEGKLTARVVGEGGGECTVTIAAEPVPPRIWAVVSRSARGKGALELAAEGLKQSVHLEHLMTVDWEEPLVPRPRALRRRCTCGDADAPCRHVAALGYVIADEIDRDPSLLLRFRGCVAAQPKPEAPDDAAAEPVPEHPALTVPDDVWLAGPLPAPRALRPLPVGAVMKRLGPSGVKVGGKDLADVLLRAYASFAASPRR